MKKAVDSRMVLVILSIFVLSTMFLPGYTTMVYAAEQGAGAGAGAGSGAGTAGAVGGTAVAAGVGTGTIIAAVAIAAAAAIAIAASGGTTSTSVTATGTYNCLPVWANSTADPANGGTFTAGSNLAEYVCSSLDLTTMHHILADAHTTFGAGSTWASFHDYLQAQFTTLHNATFTTSH